RLQAGGVETRRCEIIAADNAERSQRRRAYRTGETDRTISSSKRKSLGPRRGSSERASEGNVGSCAAGGRVQGGGRKQLHAIIIGLAAAGGDQTLKLRK